MVFFNFSNFFDIFFLNFLSHLGSEGNGTIIFILSLSPPFATYFGLKWSLGIFLFFLLFFLNFVLRMWLERNGTIIFLFSRFDFFAIFLEFPITHQPGTERNDDFYLLSLSAFSNLLWLEMKLLWYYFNLLNCFFCYFFGIFSYVSGRNETKQ